MAMNNEAISLWHHLGNLICNTILIPVIGEGVLEAIAETEVVDGGLNCVYVSGKIVEISSKPLSMWTRMIENDRKLVILEQVERTVAKIHLDLARKILKMDSNAEALFDRSSKSMENEEVSVLLPHLTNTVHQVDFKGKTTALSREGTKFPVAVKIQAQICTVVAYHNLSGLVIINQKGQIESFNEHFINLMFGLNQVIGVIRFSEVTSVMLILF